MHLHELERASRRIAASVFVAQSLGSAAYIAALTLIAVVAAELSGSEDFAGLPSTVTTFGRALFAFPLGLLLDRLGRRLGLSLAYSLGIVATGIGIVAIVQESFVLFLLAAALLGFFSAGSQQSRYIVAESFPEARRARIIGFIVFAGAIGSVAGPALVAPSGDLAESVFGVHEYAGAWGAALLLISISVLVTLSFLRPDPLSISREIARYYEAEQPVLVGYKRPLREIFRNSQVQVAVLAMLIAQTVMQMLMVMTSLHMKHHDHGTGAISLVLSAHTLGMFALAPLSGYLIDRLGRINMLLGGAVILLLACLLAPLSTATLPLVLSLYLLGLGWNFCFVGGSSLLSDALWTEERGSAQGFSEMLVSFVAALGTLAAGPIFKRGDYIAVAVVGLLLTLLLTGIIGRYHPQAQDASSLELPA